MLEATELANVVLQESSGGISGPAAAALAVGLGALGTGYAQSRIGAAAVGAVAEDEHVVVLGDRKSVV